jgi:hypothetical protein
MPQDEKRTPSAPSVDKQESGGLSRDRLSEKLANTASYTLVNLERSTVEKMPKDNPHSKSGRARSRERQYAGVRQRSRDYFQQARQRIASNENDRLSKMLDSLGLTADSWKEVSFNSASRYQRQEYSSTTSSNKPHKLELLIWAKGKQVGVGSSPTATQHCLKVKALGLTRQSDDVQIVGPVKYTEALLWQSIRPSDPSFVVESMPGTSTQTRDFMMDADGAWHVV